MLEPTARMLVAVVSVLTFLGGLVGLAVGGVAGIQGLWAVAMGGAGILAVTFERRRYLSEAAERSGHAPGPGGGEELNAIEARFRGTEEAFVDPTSGRHMRVYVDARTGERRYVAEG